MQKSSRFWHVPKAIWRWKHELILLPVRAPFNIYSTRYDNSVAPSCSTARGRPAVREMVLMNASAALYVAGKALDTGRCSQCNGQVAK